MGRYTIVASLNDDYDNGLELKSFSYNNLYIIDRLTSKCKLSVLWGFIRSCYDVRGFNKLVIKENYNNKIRYYDIISKDYVIDSCSCDVFFDTGIKRHCVNRKNKYFIREKNLFLDMIENEDINILREIFFDDDIFKYILRYKNSFYDCNELGDKAMDLDYIIKRFSCYDVFRKWIVRKDLNFLIERDVDNNGVVDNEYYQALLYNDEFPNEEFIHNDELSMMGFVEQSEFDNNNGKGRNRRHG